MRRPIGPSEQGTKGEPNWLRDHLDNGTACIDMGEYQEYRADGWPLCPKCGEDELQNPYLEVQEGRAAPSLQAFITDGLYCLRCGWESREWKKHYR